jgi:hypothetical protein
MKQSPSLNAYACTGIEDITFTQTLWNTNFRYRIHNSPPLFHVLKEINSDQTPPQHLFPFYIIHPSKERLLGPVLLAHLTHMHF